MSLSSRFVRDRVKEPVPSIPGRHARKSGRVPILLSILVIALQVAGCTDTPPVQTGPSENADENAGENADQPSTGHHTITVTDATFQSEVLASEQLVLVDVWASWCGPCVQLAPIIEETAAAYEGRVTVAKLNWDENPDIAGRYEVTALPTLLFIRDGQVVDTVKGLRTKRWLSEKLDALLASSE